MYDDVQDRIWEMEKSWRNNLIFHGVRYDDPNVEEDPNRTEEKVRTVIKVDLQLSRDIPILRAYRIRNGPLVKGTHPILGWLYESHMIFFVHFKIIFMVVRGNLENYASYHIYPPKSEYIQHILPPNQVKALLYCDKTFCKIA